MPKLAKQIIPEIEREFIDSGKKDRICFDSELPGFGLRLRSGSKRRVFIVQFEKGGVQRRITLGTTAVLSIERARAAAKEILAKVTLGGDPTAEAEEERARAKITLKATWSIIIWPCASPSCGRSASTKLIAT